MRKTTIFCTVLAMCLALMLSGCADIAKPFLGATFGMSQDEVKQKFGEPAKESNAPQQYLYRHKGMGGQDGAYYLYFNEGGLYRCIWESNTFNGKQDKNAGQNAQKLYDSLCAQMGQSGETVQDSFVPGKQAVKTWQMDAYYVDIYLRMAVNSKLSVEQYSVGVRYSQGQYEKQSPGETEAPAEASAAQQQAVVSKGGNVIFSDAVLEAKVQKALNKPGRLISKADAEKVKYLALNAAGGAADSEKIKDISALAVFINVQELELGGNDVTDLTPLKAMKLERLSLKNNAYLTDISPLKTKDIIMSLDLSGCNISDISALAGFVNLKELLLKGNPITDFAPLRDIYPKLEIKDFTL